MYNLQRDIQSMRVCVCVFITMRIHRYVNLIELHGLIKKKH